jgi:hypothetical protein
MTRTQASGTIWAAAAAAAWLAPAVAAAEPVGERGSWPEGFEPFVIGDPEGAGTLRIALAAQALYEMDVDDVQTRDARIDDWGGRFRRLRFVLSGHLGVSALTYLLHLSTLPSSLELMDFWLQYEVGSWLSVRAGAFKIPLTRYRLNSFKGLAAVDWSVVTAYFGAERQKGLMLHGAAGGGFAYRLAVVTGVASRPPHARGIASLYGESVPNPSDLTGPARNERIHPELVLHLAYTHGPFSHATEADVKGGPLRVSAGVSAAWDARPERGVDAALRVAPELWLEAYGFHAQATGCLGFVQMGPDVSDTSFALVGAVAHAGYTWRGRVDVTAQYAMVATMEKMRTDAMNRASRIVAAAASLDDLLELMDRYGPAGTFESRHETTLAVTFFVIGRNLEWASDLTWIATSAGGGRLHELRFRSQIQLTF